MSRWLLTYDGYDPAAEGLREALCTLGNGYLAVRGAAPESAADGTHYPGTYVAGCYDRLASRVAGRTVENEDLVNLPNPLCLAFRIEDGDWFSVDEAARAGRLHSHHQELDMRRGVLTRLVRFTDAAGRTTRVTQRRIASMDDPHLIALETTIVPEDWNGRLAVRSAVDGRVVNSGVARYRELNGRHLVPEEAAGHGDDLLCLRVRTATSRVEVAVAARTRASAPARRETLLEEGWGAHDLFLDAFEGEPVTVEKTAALFTSRDRAIEECAAAARARAERADGFDALLGRHALAWGRLWRRCQIRVDHDDVQWVLNLHMFHLLQTASEHSVDLDAGVPARGWHGEAYRGHLLWYDLFILPFLSLRFPEIARASLMYRWRRLPEARRAAREDGRRGAMYPWQSGGDGGEETQRMHLNPRSGRWLPDNSRLQRHVGLGIAYNVWRFYEATGDAEFLAEYGAEMVLEIARFFADLADYDRAEDRYGIRGVMGPDEYHDGYPDREEPGLDDNAYTNVLTVWVLWRALDTLALLPEERRVELCEKLSLSTGEIARMEDVARKMRIPFHDGVVSQFEGYGRLAELDWAGLRAEHGDIRRLDRVLESVGDSTNRYKASKQADVLMLVYLLTSEELETIFTRLGYPWDEGLIDRTVEYYLPRTSNGSTLSALVHAWILARTDGEAAWRLFLETLHGDVTDVQGGTTPEGIHLGAMAGTVDLVQRCYGGVSTRGHELHLDPRLPAGIAELRLGLRYRGDWGLDLTCAEDRLCLTLRRSAASPVDVVHAGRRVTVPPGGSWEAPLADGRPVPREGAPPHRPAAD